MDKQFGKTLITLMTDEIKTAYNMGFGAMAADE